MAGTPSAQYSLTIRVEIAHRPGMLGEVATAIGRAGGTIGAVDLVEVTEDGHTLRDITVDAADSAHWPGIVEAIDAVPDARVIDTTDRTFLIHMGGKIEQRNKVPVATRDDLSMAYTPGVARVCSAIAEDPGKAFQYTIKRNTVAVVSDGTAVLGLGDIGPEAALPVMEGKAMLFKEFGAVDAAELLEEHRLALHHRHRGRRADVAEAEDGGAVGHDRDRVGHPRVVAGVRRVGRDRLADLRDTRRVGQGELGGRGETYRGHGLHLPADVEVENGFTGAGMGVPDVVSHDR